MSSELTNLLQETLETLRDNGKTSSDVIWVGSGDGTKAITWDLFAEFANVGYDSGCGGHEINGGLVVVGDDWWLERGEYDGSEWWDFKERPRLQENPLPFNNVLLRGYQDAWTI